MRASHLLGLLAAIGSDTPPPRHRAYTFDPANWPKTPAPPIAPLRECLQIIEQKGSELRHRLTGDVRSVRVWQSGEVEFRIGTKTVRRTARRALDWLRNAEAVGAS